MDNRTGTYKRNLHKSLQVEPSEVMLIANTGSGPSEFGYPNKSEHVGNGMSYTNSATCNSHTRSMLI